MAGCTGLRRGELNQLLWSDIHLDIPQPFIDVRAKFTKNLKSAIIPLIPLLSERLKGVFSGKLHFTEKVFPRGLPSVTTLTKDLIAYEIPCEDKRGFRVDFQRAAAYFRQPSRDKRCIGIGSRQNCPAQRVAADRQLHGSPKHFSLW